MGGMEGGVTVVSMYCMREESVFNKKKRERAKSIFFLKKKKSQGMVHHLYKLPKFMQIYVMTHSY